MQSRTSLADLQRDPIMKTYGRDEFEGRPVWQAAPHFPLDKILAVWFLLLFVLSGQVAMSNPHDRQSWTGADRMTFIAP